MVSSINSDLKFLLLVYINQSKVLDKWTRIERFITQMDNPHAYLIRAFHDILPKIVPLILEYKYDLDQILVSANEMRKLAILSLIPDLSGVKAPDIDKKFLKNLGNSNNIFKNLMMAILVVPFENLKQTDVLEMLKRLLNLGISISLVRSVSIHVGTHIDNSYGQKMKVLITNAQSKFNEIWGFHAERRNFLRYQLRQIYHLSQEEKIIIDKFQIVITALQMAKNEIFWYFRNLALADTDKKIKSKGVLDLNIFELLNLITSLGTRLIEIQECKIYVAYNSCG